LKFKAKPISLTLKFSLKYFKKYNNPKGERYGTIDTLTNNTMTRKKKK